MNSGEHSINSISIPPLTCFGLELLQMGFSSDLIDLCRDLFVSDSVLLPNSHCNYWTVHFVSKNPLCSRFPRPRGLQIAQNLSYSGSSDVAALLTVPKEPDILLQCLWHMGSLSHSHFILWCKHCSFTIFPTQPHDHATGFINGRMKWDFSSLPNDPV